MLDYSGVSFFVTKENEKEDERKKNELVNKSVKHVHTYKYDWDWGSDLTTPHSIWKKKT